jgi:iron only hydrogenase large subunit-like protein
MEFKKKEKYLCMLAPSFAAEFDYPQIIYRLRMLGFDEVVELTFGAKMVNLAYYNMLKESIEKGEKKTWIASPCPTVVNMIRLKFPNLVPNLVPVLSPMGAMALICKKYYPDYHRVFVGPCITKKLEAGEIGTVDEVWTFKELEEKFKEKNIPDIVTDPRYCVSFEKFYNDYTKIYPISGGLSSTLHYKNILKEKDILVTEGIEKIMKILSKFENGMYKHYRFLDVLACEGGCIGGPGMIGKKSIRERRKRIVKYKEYASRYEKDLGRTGKKLLAKDINFSRKF